MRRSPSTARIRDTTSCEVGPLGLSTTNRPSIKLQDGRIAERQEGDTSTLQSCNPAGLQFHDALDLFHEQLLQRVDAAGDRAARRILVSAAAEFFRNRADIDVAFGTHADAVLLAFDLLEEDDRVNLLHGQR